MILEIMPLITIAALTGIVHTLLGPDHYLPFVALSKTQSWSVKKTAWITSLCGLGHIASSVIIGYLAFGLRVSLSSLHVINSYRSDLAAWALIAFGCVYFIWSLKKLYREKREGHDHFAAGTFSPVFLSLFIIFVVGPCEPLFVLMSYPAYISDPASIALLIGIFGTATIATMLTVVLTASYGLSFIRYRPSMQFAPVIAGTAIMLCGFGMKFLGI